MISFFFRRNKWLSLREIQGLQWFRCARKCILTSTNQLPLLGKSYIMKQSEGNLTGWAEVTGTGTRFVLNISLLPKMCSLATRQVNKTQWSGACYFCLKVLTGFSWGNLNEVNTAKTEGDKLKLWFLTKTNEWHVNMKSLIWVALHKTPVCDDSTCQ